MANLITVLGWFGHQNIGDEAYRVSFPLLFPQDDLIFREKLNHDEAGDLLILGGGDVFYAPFTDQVGPYQATIKVACSVSLTPNSNFPAFDIFDAIYARDHHSCSFDIDRIKYLPDATFMMTPDPEAGKVWLKQRFREAAHELYERIIVCVLGNHLTYNKHDSNARDFTQFLYLAQAIAQVADETNASFVFLPFSTMAPRDDRVANAWVADRCKYYQKNLVIWETLDPQTALNLIAASNGCISGRLHSSIFATIGGIPFVDLTHHTKNAGFIDSLSVICPEALDWRMPPIDFSPGRLKRLLSMFTSNPKNGKLTEFTEKAKEMLREEASSILR